MTGERDAVSEDHTFTLNGDERWLVRFTTLEGGAYGYTYSQKSKRPRILIHDGLRGRHKLTILTHELLHALFPTASEEHVEQAGKDISKVLYSLGYREVIDGS
jgi:hypothetical protein